MRRMLITWIAAWPTITGLLLAFEGTLSHWPLALRTLVLTGLMVPVMTLVVVPAITIFVEHIVEHFHKPLSGNSVE